jgi:hypothetical protein
VTFEDLLRRLVPILERSKIPYMLTGSVASSAHGLPRSTRDLDIVIAPTRQQLLALMLEFPSSDYYADEQQALEALVRRSQFNVIDHTTGWKVDFIIAEDSEYGHAALARRKAIDMAGNAVYVASAEDVLLAKLQWAKMSGSERQLQDAAGIVSTQAENLDVAYIENWVRKLGLEEQWDVVRQRR